MKEGGGETKDVHFEYPVAFPDAGLFGGASVQDGADVLQGGVQFPVYAPQLSALAHLSANVEPEPCFRFVYGHHSGAAGAVRHPHRVETGRRMTADGRGNVGHVPRSHCSLGSRTDPLNTFLPVTQKHNSNLEERSHPPGPSPSISLTLETTDHQTSSLFVYHRSCERHPRRIHRQPKLLKDCTSVLYWLGDEVSGSRSQ